MIMSKMLATIGTILKEMKNYNQEREASMKTKRRKDNIKNSPNHYETHSRKYVEKMVCDFINDNQIMAHYGKDKQGIFEVRFEVKDE